MIDGGPRHQQRRRQGRDRARGRRGRRPRQRCPRRRQPRSAGRPAGRPADHHRWQHDPAPLLVGSQLDRRRRQLHQGRWRRLCGRRWRRVDLDPEPGYGWHGQHGPAPDRDVSGDLHGDDRNRRHRGRALRRVARVPGRVLVPLADADGGGPGERSVRERDRADGHQDEARRSRDQGRDDRRAHRHRRRVQPSRRPRWKGSPSCSPSAARATTSPPATPASSPTAPPPS